MAESVDRQPRRQRAALRWTLVQLRRHSRAPAELPRPDNRTDQFMYGLAQPILGLRVIFRHAELLGTALAPVIGVGLICALFGYFKMEGETVWEWVKLSLTAFMAMAVVPPVLFTRVYAHLAARARNLLGLGPCEPYLRGIDDALVESIAQLVVITIGFAPLSAIAGWTPIVGPLWALAVTGLWSLHWIVIEAFDSSRALLPGETVDQLEREAKRLPGLPWFTRLYHDKPKLIPDAIWAAPRAYGNLVATLAKRWRAEVVLVEAHPWIAVGFGLGTALLLAIPGINLMFRPSIIVAAAHVRGQIETAAVTKKGGTAPYPAIGTVTKTAPPS